MLYPALSLFPTGTRCSHCWLCCLRNVSRPHRAQSASPQPASMSTLRTLCTNRSRSASLSSARTPNSTTWYHISFRTYDRALCFLVHLYTSVYLHHKLYSLLSVYLLHFLSQLQHPLLIEAIRVITQL